MARSKKGLPGPKANPPNQKQLATIWSHYRRGKSWKEIAKITGLSYTILTKGDSGRRSREYIRRKEAQLHARPVGAPPGPRLLDDKTRQLLIMYSALDLPFERIANILGIHRSTIYDWQKKDSTLKEEMENSKDYIASLAMNGLIENVKGYSHEDVKIFHQDIVETRIDPKTGEKVITERRVYDKIPITKHYRPDTKASETLLINLKSWTRDNESKPPNADEDVVEFDIRKGLLEEGSGK